MRYQGDKADSRQGPTKMAEPIDLGWIRGRSAIKELKEKIRSSADESREIRIGTTRNLNDAEKLRIETKLTHAGWMPHQIRRQLARARKLDPDGLAKARERLMSALLKGFNPQEHPPELPASYEAAAHALHLYRTCELRPKLRQMGLAYGFLRGIAYRSMEAKSYSPPPWQLAKARIREMRKRGAGDNAVAHAITASRAEFDEIIANHSPGMSPLDRSDALEKWIEAAGEWKHPDRQEAEAGGALGQDEGN